MRICLIGPGIMPIPPNGWGAVEILMWEYKCELEKLGHIVDIINTKNLDEIVFKANDNNYDFVHLHYDVFYPILEKLTCPFIGFSSHYPYVDQLDKHGGDNYGRIFNYITKENWKKSNTAKIFAISNKDRETFIKHGAPEDQVFIIENGANQNQFRFNETCLNPHETVYLGKLSERKRQHLFQGINGVKFIGKRGYNKFNYNIGDYLGEWSTEKKFNELTNFANLILLSTGENGTPLVVKEAFMAGLGVVVSEFGSTEIDLSLPFIDLVPENRIQDKTFVEMVIKENRLRSIKCRKEIREYGLKHFTWESLVKKYSNLICELNV